MQKDKRQSVFSWVLTLALVLFCLSLGALQYRWIGEVSVAARERLRAGLESNLRDLSRDFDLEITAACRRLIPRNPVPDASAAEAEVRERFISFATEGGDTRLFQSIGLAVKGVNGLDFRRLNLPAAKFEPADWPADWSPLRERLEARLEEAGPNHRPPGPPPQSWNTESSVLEAPLWGSHPGSDRDPRQARPGPREEAWIILQLNMPYVRDVLLPQIIRKYFAATGPSEYDVQVVNRSGALIYRSGDARQDIAADADASVALFNVPSGTALSQEGGHPPPEDGPPGLREPGGPPPNGNLALSSGRWQLYVRNRAGSLEAVVARARWLNILVTSGILLLLLATVAALIRFTRRAQRLAELQVEFVANVSHELRTPVAVIHTAAYNLKGSVATQPKQVERYGAIIQQESARLKELVEQVLQFASARAGRAVREREPVSVQQVIAEVARSLQSVVEEAGCILQQDVDPSLPPVLGDRAALKQALQNLIGNAVKYGSDSEKWVGITAAKAAGHDPGTIEIRVSDRGPGIPEDERNQIFEPFFRGRSAVRNQVHGTGLGLSLVKRVVEAHHGEIEVKSEAFHGTEFIVRLPAIGSAEPYAHPVG